MNQTTVRWPSPRNGVPGRGECVPGGDFACYVPGDDPRIQTESGVVDVDQPMLFLRLKSDGSEFAAVGHSDNQAYEYDGWEWQGRGPTCGTNAVIYDAGDNLVVVGACAPPTGAQGWSYVAPNGALVSIDASYFDPSTGLHNFTDLGDCYIGQGGKEIGQGAVVMFKDDRILRRLTVGELRPTGQLRDIRGRYNGAHKAITVVDYDEQLTTFTWCSSDELRAMLPVVATPPVDKPPIDPPKPMSIPNLKHILDGINAQFPHLIAQNTAETVHEFHWRGGWALHQADPRFGFLSKSAGENGHEINGQRVAVDAYAYDGATPIIDALLSAGDGPGKGGVTWGEDPHRRESNKWVRPVPFPGGPVDPPIGTHTYDGGDNDTGECDRCGQPRNAAIHGVTPPVDKPPLPDAAISARFAAIEKLLGALEWRHDEQRRELDALKLEVVRIADRPPAPADLSGLRAKGSVKVPILGSVNVNLPVVKE